MNISPQEFSHLLAEAGCQVIDVREPVEHAEASIAGAKLIPLGEVEKRAAELDRTRPVLIHCHSGKRGTTALQKLQQLGFSDLRNLDGGILAWKAAGLPCVTGSKKTLPLMRQTQVVIGLGVLAGTVLSLTVHPSWIYLAMFFGAGLVFAGLSGWCGLALLLAKMPWNQPAKPKNAAPAKVAAAKPC